MRLIALLQPALAMLYGLWAQLPCSGVAVFTGLSGDGSNPDSQGFSSTTIYKKTVFEGE